MALRIALTGASGFVGRAVLPLLAAAGHSTAVLLRKPPATPVPAGCRVVQGGLSDAVALQELTRDADVVLHIAGAISGVTAQDFLRTNRDGTLALSEAAHRNGVKRFVFVSSLAAREPSISHYAASKRAAEDALAQFTDAMQVLVLRPAAVYGPGDKATLPLLAALLSRVAVLPGQREQRFSLIHVEDLARICVEAVSSPITGLRELDDGEGDHGWDALIAISRQHFGRPQQVAFLPRGLAMGVGHAGDAVARLRGRPSMVSAAKMRELYFPSWVTVPPGWPRSQAISLRDGLPSTIEAYQAQGLLPRVPVVAKSRSTTGSGNP